MLKNTDRTLRSCMQPPALQFLLFDQPARTNGRRRPVHRPWPSAGAPRAAPRPASAPRRANWDTKKSNFSHFHCFGSRPYGSIISRGCSQKLLAKSLLMAQVCQTGWHRVRYDPGAWEPADAGSKSGWKLSASGFDKRMSF